MNSTETHNEQTVDVYYKITDISNNLITAIKGYLDNNTNVFTNDASGETIKLFFAPSRETTGEYEGCIKLTVHVVENDHLDETKAACSYEERTDYYFYSNNKAIIYKKHISRR